MLTWAFSLQTIRWHSRFNRRLSGTNDDFSTGDDKNSQQGERVGNSPLLSLANLQSILPFDC